MFHFIMEIWRYDGDIRKGYASIILHSLFHCFRMGKACILYFPHLSILYYEIVNVFVPTLPLGNVMVIVYSPAAKVLPKLILYVKPLASILPFPTTKV